MIYCCFDTAINGEYSLFKMRNQYKNNCCLFEDTEDERLQDVAPWLFQIDSTYIFDAFEKDNLVRLDYLVFIESQLNINELHQHLKQFIYYIHSQEESWFFRLADSRAMYFFLTNADKSQLIDFFEHAILHVYCTKDEQIKKCSISDAGYLKIDTVPKKMLQVVYKSET